MSDFQWEALKGKVLLTTMKQPGPNASAALNAMKEMDKQRKERRLGTREAVERTKEDCLRRLHELDSLEEWYGKVMAEQQGVSDTTKVGDENPTGEHGSKETA